MQSIDFFLWFHEGDQLLIPTLAERVIEWHPESRIFILSDGFYSEGLDIILFELHQCYCFRNEDHLKQHGCCDKYIHRGLSQVLANSQAQQFVQLEPDSTIRRRLHIPAVDWAGQLVKSAGQLIATKGAGALFSRKALESLASGLEGAEPTDFRDSKGQPCTDTTIAYHLTRLGYSPETWLGADGTPEVRLLPEYDPDFGLHDWGITHPVESKNFTLDPILKWKMTSRSTRSRSARAGRL